MDEEQTQPTAEVQELEELAALQFTLDECATIMGMDFDYWMRSAYERGRLKAVAEVRKAVLQQAKQGSTPAQKQMLELMAETSVLNNAGVLDG